MAIQNRRGLEADFMPNKMLPAEFAVSTDEKILRICFASGDVEEVALKGDLDTQISQISATLSARMTTIESGHQDAVSRIVILEGRANRANDALENHLARIQSLEGTAQTHSTQINSLTSASQTHDNDIASLKANVQSNSQQITSLANTSRNHTDRITTLESRTNANQRQIDELASKDVVWTFEVNSEGHLIETVERYDPYNTTFALNEGRLTVTYG